MQEFDQIEALWAEHTVDVRISSEDMLKQAKKDVQQIRNKSLLTIVAMALSVFAVATIWLFYDITSIFTHLGISIIVLSITVYTTILYANHRVIANTNFTVHPQIFLSKLHIYQVQRHEMYNKLYWFYIIALSLGMGLYFIEVLSHLSTSLQLIIIIFSFTWIIFCSTLVRKAVIKKDAERIALLIEKFERISRQFKENP